MGALLKLLPKPSLAGFKVCSSACALQSRCPVMMLLVLNGSSPSMGLVFPFANASSRCAVWSLCVSPGGRCRGREEHECLALGCVRGRAGRTRARDWNRKTCCPKRGRLRVISKAFYAFVCLQTKFRNQSGGILFFFSPPLPG